MALNKFMHPRNIYKNPPDFVQLAKKFTEFSSISKMDVSGKLSIDFKDPKCLRILTKCLLKSDFDLDVEIPNDRLVPTLPLRLNYILWLEDLLSSIQRESEVWGIDIGTGACAIYPLLAAVKNKWHMLGTETDAESMQKAQENVNRNNLSLLIKVIKNPTKSLVDHLFEDGTEKTFDFCMCNPPFYSSVQELIESRSPARPPPRNGFTGSPQELITEGGELEFCRKLIAESKLHKDKIRIFTTMVGHKYNLKELAQDLRSEGVECTSTEFCQGRVTRWGLAWTFREYRLQRLVPPRDKQVRKKTLPITYVLPKLENVTHEIDPVFTKVKSLLEGLDICCKIINKRKKLITWNVVAKTNTWSNQRRKRRLTKKLGEDTTKKIKLDETESNSSLVDDKTVNPTPNTSIGEVTNESSNNVKETKCSTKENDTAMNTENSFCGPSAISMKETANKPINDTDETKYSTEVNTASANNVPVSACELSATKEPNKFSINTDETNCSIKENTDSSTDKSSDLSNISLDKTSDKSNNIDEESKCTTEKNNTFDLSGILIDKTSDKNSNAEESKCPTERNNTSSLTVVPNDTSITINSNNSEIKGTENNHINSSTTVANITEQSSENKTAKSTVGECSTDTLSVKSNNDEDSVLIQAFLKIFKKDEEIFLEAEFLDGTAGKEGLHQILQYIKNNYK